MSLLTNARLCINKAKCTKFIKISFQPLENIDMFYKYEQQHELFSLYFFFSTGFLLILDRLIKLAQNEEGTNDF